MFDYGTRTTIRPIGFDWLRLIFGSVSFDWLRRIEYTTQKANAKLWRQRERKKNMVLKGNNTSAGNWIEHLCSGGGWGTPIWTVMLKRRPCRLQTVQSVQTVQTVQTECFFFCFYLYLNSLVKFLLYFPEGASTMEEGKLFLSVTII